MSMDFNEVIPDILRRLERVEKALQDKLSSQDIEAMIGERYPETAAQKAASKKK